MADIPDEILNLMAQKFRLLGEPTRLAIVRTLMKDGEKNVNEVVRATRQGQANVSKHLKQLAQAGLVARRKEGLQVFYRLDDPIVEKLCRLVCDSILNEVTEQMNHRRELLGRDTDDTATQGRE